ncbi:RNA-binding (RRM/RBD/RNP motifs) family protein [Striga asiatica]|uniref:RNA-binding (RRM/RBD/RNP motifs) family protein n=1 Tax=Striga asiatica TaxID=4170 RepID=A0A5A7R3A7_STRAF|nr:RNA-binding (RRM/RBD/RNP motifs) family protein [Striga asiatica]
MIGHIEKACTLRMEDIKHKRLQEGQFGDWMRASDGLQSQNWNHANSSSGQSQDPAPSPSNINTNAHSPGDKEPITNHDAAKSSSHSQIGHQSTDTDHNGALNAEHEVRTSDKELILYSPPSDQADKTLAHIKPNPLEVMAIDDEDQSDTKLPALTRIGSKSVSKGATTWKRTPQKEGRLQRKSKGNSLELSMIFVSRPHC